MITETCYDNHYELKPFSLNIYFSYETLALLHRSFGILLKNLIIPCNSRSCIHYNNHYKGFVRLNPICNDLLLQFQWHFFKGLLLYLLGRCCPLGQIKNFEDFGGFFVMISWLCNLNVKEHIISQIPYCKIYHHSDVSQFNKFQSQ